MNSTFSGNQASSGGAIQTSGELKGSFVTIVENSASASGGGILADLSASHAVASMKHSIVANNVAGARGSNCWLLVATGDSLWGSFGTNLASDGTCVRFTTTTQLNLGPLSNNGGLTETHALLPGSAAIEAATNCTDLDGATVS